MQLPITPQTNLDIIDRLSPAKSYLGFLLVFCTKGYISERKPCVPDECLKGVSYAHVTRVGGDVLCCYRALTQFHGEVAGLT